MSQLTVEQIAKHLGMTVDQVKQGLAMGTISPKGDRVTGVSLGPGGAKLPPSGAAASPAVNPGQFAAAQAQGSAAGSSSDPVIPLWRARFGPSGKEAGTDDAGAGVAAQTAPVKGAATASGNSSQADLYFANLLMDKDKFKEFQDAAVKSGQLAPEQANDVTQLAALWKKAVGWAQNFKVAAGVEMTPVEAIQHVAEMTGSASLAAQAYAASHFTGDKVTVDQKVADKTFGFGSSKNGLAERLQQSLGRNPTPGELAAYQHGMDAMAQANPIVTTTTHHYQNGQNTGNDSVASGGFDAVAAYQQMASADPQVAANQQATTYMTALKDALGAAV